MNLDEAYSEVKRLITETNIKIKENKKHIETVLVETDF